MSPRGAEQQLARTYYLGQIRIRLGDSAAAASMVQELDPRFRPRVGGAVGSDDGIGSRLARLARVERVVAWRSWQSAGATRPTPAGELVQRVWLGGFAVDARQVWLRAEVLAALRRERRRCSSSLRWGSCGAMPRCSPQSISGWRRFTTGVVIARQPFVTTSDSPPSGEGAIHRAQLVQQVEQRAAVLKRGGKLIMGTPASSKLNGAEPRIVRASAREPRPTALIAQAQP